MKSKRDEATLVTKSQKQKATEAIQEREDTIKLIDELGVVSLTIPRKRKRNALKDLRNNIIEEIPFVDIKEYSHNIISVILMQIGKKFGGEAANDTIRDLGLEKLGWKEDYTFVEIALGVKTKGPKC